ncbi:putative Adenine nucleotide alpha hydrolase [Vibrio nigripulchritudo MADA3029]|uniref:Dph6-related ATP pyrophosphatase n=1 Tax=Vibrio nigripulchritudo TaxID=28173 RepID=UPI0003B1EBE5|nr:adenine nucleotide alpha hydrolase [Vibrio nigripulchritudo]CCN50725.1 putative Adenine nucleotide alpha hydrolase [Vibrio nigripulchritudo MADA3020]CCN51888.1 putative Adenine nucleotide alpha hydrolase [Vibrio nigripulchritudo MADA3021]CCN60258.1 putative Adenine nucleotide alpha hydrolase [Vibrio nigripulchritudo MADA3029]
MKKQPRKVVISWSSGKDSTLTLIRLLEDPNYEVVGLYTTYVGEEVPFQVTPIEVVKMQAELANLPLVMIQLPEVFPPNEIYQNAIVQGLEESDLKIDAVAFGDMFCNGIIEYRKSYIEKAGWECVFPLMETPSIDLANEILARGIQTIAVTIDGHRLPKALCGKWYNTEFIDNLPEGIDPCGENGEFHTLVTSASCFKGSLSIKAEQIESGERFHHLRYKAKIGERTL